MPFRFWNLNRPRIEWQNGHEQTEKEDGGRTNKNWLDARKGCNHNITEDCDWGRVNQETKVAFSEAMD